MLIQNIVATDKNSDMEHYQWKFEQKKKYIHVTICNVYVVMNFTR